jgi:hypothetical protein
MNKQTHSKVLSGLIFLLFFLAGVSLCRAATDISPTLLAGSSLQVRSTEEDGLFGAEVNGMSTRGR